MARDGFEDCDNPCADKASFKPGLDVVTAHSAKAGFKYCCNKAKITPGSTCYGS